MSSIRIKQSHVDVVRIYLDDNVVDYSTSTVDAETVEVTISEPDSAELEKILDNIANLDMG